jgi:SAM-dependent methyltransferase
MGAAFADGWNHNSHYHELLLELVPSQCEHALDVGCGLGTLARRLSPLAGQVDALEKDPAAIRGARERSAHALNIRFIEADFMTWPADKAYDFISMVAVLHHLPLEEALTKASGLLRPGGTLAVLGLDSANSLFHAAARGSIGQPVSLYYRVTRRTSVVGAPTLEPTMTLGEIRRRLDKLLPGATIRRHLLWRYSLVWTKKDWTPRYARRGPRAGALVGIPY